MKNIQVGSKEFFQEHRELTITTFQDKVSRETLQAILALVPEDNGPGKAADTLSVPARVNVTAAFIYGTVDCEVDMLKKEFGGKHWGIGLAGFASSGILYTACSSWNGFFVHAAGYHVQCAGAGGGAVQVIWFTSGGVPVGLFMGIAGGAGAMEVGGKGSWKPMR